MIVRLIFVLITLCLANGQLQATITQIDHLERFEQVLADLDSDDLVLFDVDGVLLVPNDAVLRPVGKPFLKRHLAVLKSEELWGHVLAAMTWSLVDEHMPDIVRGLQQREIPAIALTAMWSGKLGPVDNCADLRIGRLREHGFDFRNAFAHLGYRQWPGSAISEHKPTFKSGVLFSPKYPKGETLKHFLDAAAWVPRRIVFIDDKEEFLKSVEAAADERGIAFEGFHYTAVAQMPTTFDERIAEIQLRYLIEHHEWLSDQAARQLGEYNECLLISP